MKILQIKNLAGPNYWANFPVLEVWIDLEEFRDSPSDTLPGFNERLMNWLPSMIEHRCSEGVRGGFFERLRRGTWLGHILEHTTLELQSLAGHEVGFGRARETPSEGVYRVAIEYKEEEVAKAAIDSAFRLLLAAIHDTPFDVAQEVERLKNIIEDVGLGPSTQAIADAATKRNIPWRRLTKGSLIRFGHGIHQKKIQAAETDATSAIAESIAQDKQLTRQLLKEVGLPVPYGGPVESLQEALDEADYIAGPVVIKPRYGNQGRGVATNLESAEQITAAYCAAMEISSDIIIEEFIPGDDYRVLVVGNQVVAAARREPAAVVGDGRSTVEELIEIANQDPRRCNGHSGVLTKLHLDEISLNVLNDQGLTPRSVPAQGVKVLIRRNANLSTGGTAIDVTDLLHPDFAARCVDAARVVGLNIAGIDVVARHIDRPLDKSNGVIVEVNAAPGLRMHLAPSEGKSRPVGEAIMNLLYAPGDTGRIPIIAVTGVNGKTTVTRMIAHVMKQVGRIVGMTCTDGIWINDRKIDTGDCSGPRSAQTVLAHPDVNTAVLETARGGILRAGLGFDRCDVAVVTNIGEGDHLGLDAIDTLEKLAMVKRTIVDVVLPNGTAVLNASDPLVAPMAKKCPGRSLLFAISPDDIALQEHAQLGHPVAFVRDGQIIISHLNSETVIDQVSSFPVTRGGKIRFQIENLLAAAGALWSAGIPSQQIADGLRSFQSDEELCPGRFNFMQIHDATVIVDYGHNPSALEAMVQAIDSIGGNTRRVVYSTAGDRRDCDIQRQGQLLGRNFDQIYLYEGHYTRGRAKGETLALFESGMNSDDRRKIVLRADSPINAAQVALDELEPGDILLLQADQVQETSDFLENYLKGTKLAPTHRVIHNAADSLQPIELSKLLQAQSCSLPILSSNSFSTEIGNQNATLL